VRQREGDIDHNVHRAQALVRYIDLKLTHKDIKETLGMKSTGWIDHLLRYGRFMQFSPSMEGENHARLPERQFRHYWNATVDTTITKTLRGNHKDKKTAERLTYERHIFHVIVEKYMGDDYRVPASQRGSHLATRNLAKKILAQFRDGKWHLACDIATAVDADMALVRVPPAPALSALCSDLLRLSAYHLVVGWC
jgi:hypothetical protein